jgi:hypothetical protein
MTFKEKVKALVFSIFAYPYNEKIYEQVIKQCESDGLPIDGYWESSKFNERTFIRTYILGKFKEMI